MNRLLRVLIFAATGLMSATVVQAGAEDAFVGTWDIEVIEAKRADGSWSPATGGRLGVRPLGYIMYDSGGRMAVQIMRRDRPEFTSEDRARGTAEELKAAFAGYAAYFGTFEVNEEESYVVHHRMGHLFPNDATVEVKRFYELSGDQLILTLPSGELRLTWRRLH